MGQPGVQQDIRRQGVAGTAVRWLLLGCCAAMGAAMGAGCTPARIPLVVLSIDGLRPGDVLQAQRIGAQVPNLQRLMREGAFASGVRGVVPTMTYPSHTTMLTGVSPGRHGVYHNLPLDPLGKAPGAWNWFYESVRAETLWDVARRAGLRTANVRWPVAVGAPVTWNVPQYWRYGGEEDRKLLRMLATPGLMQELETVMSPLPDNQDPGIENDERYAVLAMRLLERKQPDFMTVYMAGLDHAEHDHGPGSAEALAALARIDGIVGTLRATAERVYRGRQIFCVVSDHGFVDTDKEVHLKAAFRAEGLMTYDEKDRVTGWRAFPYLMGPTAAILLRDERDEATRAQVAALLARLAADPSMGIAQVLDGDTLRGRGGYPGAAFYVNLQPGYRNTHDAKPPIVVPAQRAGAHGYLPELAEMNASFFVVGPGVAPGRDLGLIDLRDVAPTLASLLQVQLAGAEGRAIALSP